MTDLLNGKTYNIRVAATNQYGDAMKSKIEEVTVGQERHGMSLSVCPTPAVDDQCNHCIHFVLLVSQVIMKMFGVVDECLAFYH